MAKELKHKSGRPSKRKTAFPDVREPTDEEVLSGCFATPRLIGLTDDPDLLFDIIRQMNVNIDRSLTLLKDRISECNEDYFADGVLHACRELADSKELYELAHARVRMLDDNLDYINFPKVVFYRPRPKEKIKTRRRTKNVAAVSVPVKPPDVSTHTLVVNGQKNLGSPESERKREYLNFFSKYNETDIDYKLDDLAKRLEAWPDDQFPVRIHIGGANGTTIEGGKLLWRISAKDKIKAFLGNPS